MFYQWLHFKDKEIKQYFTYFWNNLTLTNLKEIEQNDNPSENDSEEIDDDDKDTRLDYSKKR